jgi:hypothetical protein
MVYFVATDSFSEQDLNGWGFAIVGLGSLSFALVGIVLTTRLPHIPIGWIFVVGGVGGGLSLLIRSLVGPSGLVLGMDWMLVLSGVAIIATFPAGHPRGVSWRVALSILGLNAVGMIAGSLTELSTNLANVVFLLIPLSTAVIVIAAIVRLVRMYRRGEGPIRLQLKWLVLVLIVGAVLLAASAFEFGRVWRLNEVAGIVMVVGGPISIAVAILRYRLYDIDRLISRTVSYGLVVGVLGLVFAAGVVGLPRVFGLGESPLLVAGSTLAVAALFNPLRRRVQGWVDRRFNRSRYDAERVMEEFAGSLQDRVDPDGVVEGWLGVVAETMQPSSVGVWVREP